MRLVSSSFKQLTQLGLMSLDISDEGVKMLSQLNKLQVRASYTLCYLAACTCSI
jgi:hypothetical protein